MCARAPHLVRKLKCGVKVGAGKGGAQGRKIGSRRYTRAEVQALRQKSKENLEAVRRAKEEDERATAAWVKSLRDRFEEKKTPIVAKYLGTPPSVPIK